MAYQRPAERAKRQDLPLQSPTNHNRRLLSRKDGMVLTGPSRIHHRLPKSVKPGLADKELLSTKPPSIPILLLIEPPVSFPFPTNPRHLSLLLQTIHSPSHHNIRYGLVNRMFTAIFRTIPPSHLPLQRLTSVDRQTIELSSKNFWP